MQTESPITVLRFFETTSEERELFVIQLIEAIQDGEVDPLKIHAQVKSAEDLIDRITNTDEKRGKNFQLAKIYKSRLLEAAEAYGQKEFQAFNGKFKITEVGVKYDYSQCNDPELIELEKTVKEATEALKERQKFLQTVPLKGMDIITKDGEAITVYPPARSSTTSVNVSLK